MKTIKTIKANVMVQYPNERGYKPEEYELEIQDARACTDAELLEDPLATAEDITKEQVEEEIERLQFITAKLWFNRSWMLVNLYWNSNTYKIHSAPTAEDVRKHIKDCEKLYVEMQDYTANQFMVSHIPYTALDNPVTVKDLMDCIKENNIPENYLVRYTDEQIIIVSPDNKESFHLYNEND